MLNIEQIYREHKTNVFNQVLRLIKNYHDAEEITEDVFLKVMRLDAKESTQFNSELSALTTWLRTITVSVVLDYFKTNHQDKYKNVSDFVDGEGNEVFQFDAPKSTFADTPIMTAELREKVLKAFRGLKPKYRKIAVMFFMKEQSYEEIAEMLNISMGTVKGTLSRARTQLQKELNGAYNFKKIGETLTA